MQAIVFEPAFPPAIATAVRMPRIPAAAQQDVALSRRHTLLLARAMVASQLVRKPASLRAMELAVACMSAAVAAVLYFHP